MTFPKTIKAGRLQTKECLQNSGLFNSNGWLNSQVFAKYRVNRYRGSTGTGYLRYFLYAASRKMIDLDGRLGISTPSANCQCQWNRPHDNGTHKPSKSGSNQPYLYETTKSCRPMSARYFGYSFIKGAIAGNTFSILVIGPLAPISFRASALARFTLPCQNL